jgi:hypothetical protein
MTMKLALFPCVSILIAIIWDCLEGETRNSYGKEFIQRSLQLLSCIHSATILCSKDMRHSKAHLKCLSMRCHCHCHSWTKPWLFCFLKMWTSCYLPDMPPQLSSKAKRKCSLDKHMDTWIHPWLLRECVLWQNHSVFMPILILLLIGWNYMLAFWGG